MQDFFRARSLNRDGRLSESAPLPLLSYEQNQHGRETTIEQETVQSLDARRETQVPGRDNVAKSEYCVADERKVESVHGCCRPISYQIAKIHGAA